jgi:hypothetical protein
MGTMVVVVVVVVVGGAVVEVDTEAAPADAVVTLVTVGSPEVDGVEVAAGSTALLTVRLGGRLLAGGGSDAVTPHDCPNEDPEFGPAVTPPTRGRQAGVTMWWVDGTAATTTGAGEDGRLWWPGAWLADEVPVPDGTTAVGWSSNM